MTVQEIFNTTAVREVEVDVYYELENTKRHRYEGKETICRLLKIRKRILDSMFVLDENYKLLLADFNEAMKQQLIDMRKRTIALYESVCKSGISGSVEVKGKCFLGYGYSKIHPVQTMRAKKIWGILNGTIDDYMLLYCDDGVHGFDIYAENPEIKSENTLLYINEEEDNWNEGLDRELTKDMHLTYPFHNLYDHTEFSIFDLLWVRDFNIEIHVEIDSHTYPTDDWCDDLDWSKCDYYN